MFTNPIRFIFVICLFFFAQLCHALTTSEQVQQIYIGLLGRPADPAGLAYWTEQLENGLLSLEQLRANLVNEQPEYQQNYGQLANSDLIAAIYQGLFNRVQDKRGKLYWEAQLTAGALQPDQLVVAFINGASAPDQSLLANKLTVAECYTNNSSLYTTGQITSILASLDLSTAYSQCPPTAIAGSDLVIDSGTTVSLQGAGADLESDVVVNWKQIAGPVVQLDNPTSLNPSFIAPSLPAGKSEKLTLELEVTDDSGATSTDTIDIVINGPSAVLSISPAIMVAGQTAVINWNASAVSSCDARGSWQGKQDLSGSLAVSPAAGSYSYALVCQNDLGEVRVESSLTVLAGENPAQVSILINPENVKVGETAVLSWLATGVSACEGSGIGWDGAVALSGELELNHTIAGSYQYAIDCDGVSQSTVLTVSPLTPEIDFSISASSITESQHAVLTWSGTGVDSCTASGEWEGVLGVSGSFQVAPPVGSYTYTLICSSEASQVTENVQLTVLADDDTQTTNNLVVGDSVEGNLEVGGDIDRYAIALTAGTTYLFEVKGASSSNGTLEDPLLKLFDAEGSEIDYNDDGGVDLDSRLIFTPQTTGIYYLAGSSFDTHATGSFLLTTNVAENAEGIFISLSEEEITDGESTELSWFSSEVNSCMAYGAWEGQLAGSGSIVLTPTAGIYEYGIECQDATGVADSRITLFVDLDINHVTATTIETDSVVDASIDVSGEADLYAVQLSAGTKYVFEMKGKSSGLGELNNPTLTLFDPDGYIASHDLDGGFYLDSRLEIIPGISGTYYLAAQAQDSNDLGSYTLSTRINAVQLSLEPSDITEGETAALVWSVTGTSFCNAYGSWPEIPGEAGSLELTLAAGFYEYILECQTDSGIVSEYASLSVRLDTENTDLQEVTSGDVVEGELSAPGEADHYAVELSGGVTYVIEVQGLSSGNGSLKDPFLQLIDSLGYTFLTDADGGQDQDSFLEFTPGSNGTFYISIQSEQTTDSGTYRLLVYARDVQFSVTPTSITEGQTAELNWSTTFANTCEASQSWEGAQPASGSLSLSPLAGYYQYALQCGETADTVYANLEVLLDSKQVSAEPLSVGDTVAGSLDVPGEADRYTIELSAGVTYIFTVRGLSSAGGNLPDPAIQIFDNDGYSIADDNDGGQDLDSRLEFTPDHTDFYFLSIESTNSSDSGTYTLETQVSNISLTISNAYITEGTIVELSWSTLEVSTCTASGSWEGERATSGSQLISATPGLYEYALECQSSSGPVSSSRTLYVNMDTSNPLINTATPGSAIAGEIIAGSADRYAVALVAGTSYTFALKGASSGNGSLSDPLINIFDTSGVYLFSDDDSGTGHDSRLEFTPDTSGTYYLTAGSYDSADSGLYTLVLTTL